LSGGYVVLIVIVSLVLWGYGAYAFIRRPMRISEIPLAPGEELLFPHPEFTLAHQVFLTSERLLWARVPLHPVRLPAIPLLMLGRLVARRDERLSGKEFSVPLATLNTTVVSADMSGSGSPAALQIRSGTTNVGVFFTSRQNTPEAWKSAIDKQRRARG
jgi:hypothetical protein